MSLKKNLGMAQAATHANEHKFQEKAEDVGNSGMASSLPFYYRKKIPRGGERIFIFHSAVYVTACPPHI